MRKFLKKIHLYISFPFGILISLICFSGAILVFDEEIDKLFHSERFYVENNSLSQNKLLADDLVKQINSQLDSNTVKSLTLFSAKHRTVIADLKKERIKAYVNPYTGKILYKEAYNDTFYFKILSFHRWLLGKQNGIGREIVRISTIFLLVISISGLILWIPRSKDRLKKSFKISLNKSFTRFNYDLHAVGGMYVFTFIILLGITGLATSYPSVKKSLEKVFVNTKSIESKEEKEEKEEKADSTDLAKKETYPMQISLDSLQRLYPNFKSITLEPSKAFVHLNERANELVLLNKNNGSIKKVTTYAETNPTIRFNAWLYTLHVGSYWGIFSKVLTFMTAFIGGLLPLTGYYMFFKRKRKKKVKSGLIFIS